MSETEPEAPPPEWVWMTNPNIPNSIQKVRNFQAVLSYWRARNWVETVDPDSVPPPPPVEVPPGQEETTFIRLWHPVIQAHHDYPNNPAVIAAALAVGWEYPAGEGPEPDDEDPEPEPEDPEPIPADEEEEV